MKIARLTLITFFALLSFSCSKEDEDIQIDPNLVAPASKPIEIEALELINAYRIENGLSALKINDAIKAQAYTHSDYMVEKNNLSHDNFYKRSSYLTKVESAKLVTENVAYGYTKASSLVRAWIRSSKHRENMLGDYTHFDISAEQDNEGKWYYTNIFMRK